MGRPRKKNVVRDSKGRSRGEVEQIHPEVIAVRERLLEQDGIILQFRRHEGAREIINKTATDRLAGSSLGRLYLRYQQGERIYAITKEQYEAGEEWAGLVRRHSALVYDRAIDPKSGSMELGGGRSCSEPDADNIIYIRRKWSDCHYYLMSAAEDHGRRVYEATYGICVREWPLNWLYFDDIGKLKIGLNAVGKALDNHHK